MGCFFLVLEAALSPLLNNAQAQEVCGWLAAQQQDTLGDAGAVPPHQPAREEDCCGAGG